ncbi:MAG TPA: DUF123 domain-containing protein [Firmicutes bacterium]|nr:DUF123 domain-containing protein [Bacillota bacterium]
MATGGSSVIVFNAEESAGVGGVYVLRITVSTRAHVVFGAFANGKPICVEPGDYVYTGSARSSRGGTSLAARLIRHATRSGDLPPHRIRREIIDTFGQLGLWNGRVPSGKKLFWNIDHLLDRLEAELVGVIALCTSDRREGEIARYLENEPHTSYLAKGLGAHDIPGNTHLLRIDNVDAKWWEHLSETLVSFVNQETD